MDEFRLDGRLAVVTGFASGIGRAIARRFVSAGADVVGLDLRAEDVLSTAEELGTRCKGIVCDVGNEATILTAFEEIDAVGPTAILVNSAGIAHVGSLESTSTADMDRLYRVNVLGAFLAMQAAVKRMKAVQGGVVLNIASIAATAGLQDRLAYSMSKGALRAMTFSVARDYLRDGIRCNCISPARVHTPFVDGFVARNYPGEEAQQMAKLAAAQPIGRMGEPDEVALLALYLCSDAASFLTGVDYPLDGGFFNLR